MVQKSKSRALFNETVSIDGIRLLPVSETTTGYHVVNNVMKHIIETKNL